MSEQLTGKVKWFDEGKGYGFITPDNGGPDVFMHKTALDAANIGIPAEGAALGYALEESKGKVRACDLKRL